MKALNVMRGTVATVADAVSMPGMADKVREAYFRDCKRLGLSDADADDGAQDAFVRWMGSELEPVHAYYSVRKYMRKSLYRGFTGFRRDKSRKLVEPTRETNERQRGSMADNPAAIAAGMEIVHALCMTMPGRALGREARAIRAMSLEVIRSLVCPDMRGASEREPGECPRVADALPRPAAGMLPPDMRPWKDEPEGEPIPAWRASPDGCRWEPVAAGHWVSLRGPEDL